MSDAEVHLRIAHRAYPAAEWAMALNSTSDEGEGWREYLEEMYRHVWAKDFWSKEIYLGVRLGPRGAQLGTGVLAQLFGFYQRSEKALGIEDDHVPDKEITRWTEAAERLGRALASSALYARHATSSEIAWLFQHAAAGGLGEPLASATPRRRWGKGEIEALVEGQIHNGRSLLRIEQPAGDSYTAHLSFARFPDLMPFPDGEPWLHFADQLPFPVEVSSRMRLIPRSGRARMWRASWPTPATWTSTSVRRARRRRSRWPSRSTPPACWSTASPRNGCRSCTAGTG
ncbi:hypothetical protein GCM10027612_81390 [Microbispora bryophytorum subsp. camponoti]